MEQCDLLRSQSSIPNTQLPKQTIYDSFYAQFKGKRKKGDIDKDSVLATSLEILKSILDEI